VAVEKPHFFYPSAEAVFSNERKRGRDEGRPDGKSDPLLVNLCS
jgi:hypothetical protein